MGEEIEYPVSFENLMVIVSGYYTDMSFETKYNEHEGMEKLSGIKYVTKFSGNPSANLVNFLTQFTLKWKYMDKDKRMKTVENLKLLYEAIHEPFKISKFLKENMKQKHTEMIKVLSKLKLTEEFSYTLTFWSILELMISLV